MALNWDWVVTTEAMSVALTSTMASQKVRNIFRNKLRTSVHPLVIIAMHP
jgi:hypothetical protein